MKTRTFGSRVMAVLAMISLLASCDSGSGFSTTEQDTNNSDNGELVIGLTDAPGDFLSYRVDVKSLTLTKLNGAVIETLPNSTSVDFAQYVEATEFLTAATVPTGVYSEVKIVLDYSDSQVTVEGDDGTALETALVDTDGNSINGEQTVTLELKDKDQFTIHPGIPAHITLDFDLAASHQVDIAQTPAQVTVEPLLVADTLLEDPKDHRLRGLLNTVSVENNAFSVQIKPFHRRQGQFGSLRVYSLEDTAYEIDGESLSGSAGVEKMAQLETGASVIVLGSLNRGTHHFEAEQVYAGSSVVWDDQDLITGHVVARSGDVLTVRGATIVRGNNSVVFNDDISVVVGADTSVVKQGGWEQTPTTADISVGQRISASGTLLDTDTLLLDATAGNVRLLFTNLSATVVQVSPLIVDIQTINRRRASLFDFAGTGISEDQDANPNHYEIAASNLTLAEISINDPLKLRGFVNTFGAAPADFNAKTIADITALPAKMKITWDEKGSTAPFTATTESSITININDENLAELHHIWRAGVATDLTDNGVDPSLAANTNQRGLFAIAQGHRIQMFTDFAAFEARLVSLLDGETTIKRLNSSGRFDDAQAVLTTRGISVRLN